MRRGLLIPVLVALIVVGGIVAYVGYGALNTHAAAGSTSTAPGFTVPDIYGDSFSLSSYRNSSVVLLEFTSLSCSECQIVEQSLKSIYTGYNSSGHSEVHIASIYTEPQFGDTIPALRSYHQQYNITWTMAQDTMSNAVSTAYGVTALPSVFIVDTHGHIVYDVTGVQDSSKIQTTIASAFAGTAAPVSIITVSVFALAAIAGVTTFFSPCAFPMFPGYMSLFLGLNTPAKEGAATPGPTYRGAARRAAVAGSITALGMILVFLLVGVGLIYAANIFARSIPYLLVAVGVILLALGALLLTNLQYWKVITPFQQLWYRVGGKRPEENLADPVASGSGLYLKLFSYGMGYAAAAAGCVAPVIFSAIIAGLTLGLVGGIVNTLIFTLTAAALMVGVTVALAVAGRKYVNQLKALTPIIKKVSAVALILVGAYLVYFYYIAWIA
ncbi:MAG TPA: redoxin domain-containing protein [Thermoplasmata archaeon]|nr:redoxin domain-containing protein [Thermoplasmata archaeon]